MIENCKWLSRTLNFHLNAKNLKELKDLAIIDVSWFQFQKSLRNRQYSHFHFHLRTKRDESRWPFSMFKETKKWPQCRSIFLMKSLFFFPLKTIHYVQLKSKSVFILSNRQCVECEKLYSNHIYIFRWRHSCVEFKSWHFCIRCIKSSECESLLLGENDDNPPEKNMITLFNLIIICYYDGPPNSKLSPLQRNNHMSFYAVTSSQRG